MTALNRAKARAVLTGLPLTHQTLDRVLVALEACVVPDPRITRIEALKPIYVDSWDAEAYDADAVRAILRGDQ